MPPEAAALRRATRAALLLAVATLVALGLLFGVILHPVPPASCTTGLYPGAYGAALVPAHLGGFAVLAALAAWLGARRDGRRRPPARAAGALGLLVVAVALLAVLPVLGLVLLVVGPVAVLALVILGALHAVATARAELDEAERWRRHARVAEGALWTAVVLVLPAMFVAFWANGSGLFCF